MKPSSPNPYSPWTPHNLNIAEFAQNGGQLSGQAEASQMPRLQTPVQWQAQGFLRGKEIWLSLAGQTCLDSLCQRCLKPMQVPLAFAREFVFAPDEASAVAWDSEREEDVLVQDAHFNLYALIEDELVLDTPFAPRHENCPEPLQVPASAPELPEAKIYPFASLAQLRKKSTPNGGQ